MTTEAKVFTDKREALLHYTNTRDGGIYFASSPQGRLYGVAKTEHQFRLAASRHYCPEVSKLSQSDLRQWMMDALNGDKKETD